MSSTIPVTAFREGLLRLVEETFQQVHGTYLDRGTSLFETLAPVTAEIASRRVAPACACLAAQIEHVAFYLEVSVRYARGEEFGRIDWDAAWRRTGATPEEWAALQERLQAAYRGVLALLGDDATFADERVIGEVMAIVAHTAYHLGEIRQALGALAAQS